MPDLLCTILDYIREAFKNVLADFVRKGGGVPSNSVKEKNLLFSH